jgi:aspartate carbamoyltransferase catalytic subunit
MRNPQLNRHGALTHLITTEGLPVRVLSPLLDLADTLLANECELVKPDATLLGRRVFGLLDQPSLEMHQSFARAATGLCAEYVEVDVADSHGRAPQDWLEILQGLSMREGDLLVMRQQQSGAPYLVAQHFAPFAHVMNAGDGAHADPIGALAYVSTIRRLKKNFADLTVTIVGDLRDSGLARSCIHALTTLCVAEVRVVSALTLLPQGLEQMGVRCLTDWVEGARDADVLIMLPFESALTPNTLLPTSHEYAKLIGVGQEMRRHAKPDCLVLDDAFPHHEAQLLAVRMAVMRSLVHTSL